MKLELAGKSVPLLDVRGVSAGYGGMPVLQDVTLQIYPAEVVALVGSNGAGKTTLLRALSRMLPCRGSMAMNAQDLLPMSPTGPLRPASSRFQKVVSSSTA